jgi:hypothetical protein
VVVDKSHYSRRVIVILVKIIVDCHVCECQCHATICGRWRSIDLVEMNPTVVSLKIRYLFRLDHTSLHDELWPAEVVHH